MHEARAIQSSPELQARVVLSLKVMLDFFGMALSEEDPLVVTEHANLEMRAKAFENLEESSHNYLRITRILRSLVELGLPQYVPSILLFFLVQQDQRRLNNSSLRDSMDHYWIYCTRERDAQKCIVEAVRWVRSKGEFSEKAYHRILGRWRNTGKWSFGPEDLGLKIRLPEKTGGFRRLTRRPGRGERAPKIENSEQS
jgi:Opioid growth factor receptor (OGFr) conserved region